jgi:hypothetical protein
MKEEDQEAERFIHSEDVDGIQTHTIIDTHNLTHAYIHASCVCLCCSRNRRSSSSSQCRRIIRNSN